MGVPKLFRTLTFKYPHILSSFTRQKIEHLFFDLNCLIHPVCASCTNESEMNIKIVEYIQNVVSFVGPTKKIYLFMDGVAPFAKILQQRQRRYKSMYLKKIKRQIDPKSEYFLDSWDTNMISPETTFMKNLSKYIQSKLIDNNTKYMMMDTSSCGEGEHKIVDYILNNQVGNICIYGLDADLILLSWVLCIQKGQGIDIHLVREIQHYGIKKSTKPFHYMNINKLIESFHNDFYSMCKTPFSIDNISSDFIFLTFFLGNDFLPNLFGISLHSNGLNILLDKYIQCKYIIPNFHLTNYKNVHEPIHWNNLLFLFQKLYDDESKILEQFINSYLSYHPKQPDFKNEFEKKLYEFEYLKNIKSDPILINTENWEQRYIKRYFYISNTHPSVSKYDMFNIVDNYLCGLLWNFKYYFKLDPKLSYGYNYPYMNTPPLKYIIQRMKAQCNNPKNIFRFQYFLNHPYVPYKPIDPNIALSIILPNEKSISQDIQFMCDYKHFWNESFLLLPSVSFTT